MKVTIVLLSLFTATVLSFPDGAPVGTCNTLVPIHGGLLPQDTRSPFSISTSVSTLKSGSKIRLRLDSPQRVAFAGFMLQAKHSDAPQEAVGTFTSVPELAKAIDCDGDKNTLTHRDRTKKKSLEFEWEAPQDYEGPITFNATFVQDYSTYWVGVQSDPVQIVKRSVGVPDNDIVGISTTRSPLRTTIPNYTLPPERKLVKAGDAIYRGCVKTKNCFGIPIGCEGSESCSLLTTVLVEGDKYTFEVLGRRKDDKPLKYIAVALSRDTSMGEDSVMECVPDNNSKVNLYASYNGAKPTNYRQNVSRYLDLKNSTYSDGDIYCQFTREVRSNVSGDYFDLSKDYYHLLIASGTSLKPTGVGYHGEMKESTAKAFLLADVQPLSGKSKVLHKLHGAFMITAWVGFASTGILLARYFKKTWVNSQTCGTAQWFAWHRACMVSCWTLTIAGFVIIFIDVGGWYGETSNPHAILGCVTTGLVFIQPIAAIFRPAPDASTRPIFYWSHWFVGNGALILSVVTMFFAVRLSKAELPDWTDWILVAVVVFYTCMHLIFSFLGCLTDRKEEKKVNNFPMKDMNSSRSPLHSPERKKDAPSSCMRKFLLAIHLIVIIVITVGLVVVVVLAPIEQHPAYKQIQNLIRV